MKYLIIPDVHQKLVKLERVLDKVQNFNKLVSLGDWFDNFNDTPSDAKKTAEFILYLYDKYGDNFIWLLGNHDVPYVFPEAYKYARCSGVTLDKLEVIQDVFQHNLDTRKLKLAYRIKFRTKKDIILSHAGVSRYHFGMNVSGKKVVKMCDDAIDALHKLEMLPPIGRIPAILHAGKARGGWQGRGGINWLDWNMEFSPIAVMSQIVGHTPTQNPQIIDAEGNYIAPTEGSLETGLCYHIAPEVSYNINIDTHLNHYMIIENGKITIYTNYDPIN